MHNTSEQFDTITAQCLDLFSKKAIDYGAAWRILRAPSLTDQIYIKAQRIRNIQEKGESKVNEGVIPEFMGIVNYSVMALIQLELGAVNAMEELMNVDEIIEKFKCCIAEAKQLMMDKNHDYNEVWRNMRISSLVDIILMKILRVKQIEDRAGNTIVSEGIDANYYDMINYAVFALILIQLK
ncbi:MAG: DUF1599 domain-containing protein [Bacteroidales bacterium]|jgi:hypothetical protein|nr:DUF1599 domain-containing protein [Bacteroidales bacterium]